MAIDFSYTHTHTHTIHTHTHTHTRAHTHTQGIGHQYFPWILTVAPPDPQSANGYLPRMMEPRGTLTHPPTPPHTNTQTQTHTHTDTHTHEHTHTRTHTHTTHTHTQSGQGQLRLKGSAPQTRARASPPASPLGGREVGGGEEVEKDALLAAKPLKRVWLWLGSGDK